MTASIPPINLATPMSTIPPSPPQLPDFDLLSPDQAVFTVPNASGDERDTPDAGTPRSRWWAVILSILLVLGVMASQQIGALATGSTPKTDKPREVAAPTTGDQFTMAAGITVKVANTLKGLVGGKLDGASATALSQSVEDSAVAPEEHFRALVVVAELSGTGNVGEKLAEAEKTVKYAGSEEDFAILRTILDGGAEQLTESQRTALTERHGYFARLAWTLGKPDTDPARKPYVQGGGALIAFLGALGVFFVLLVLASMTCFIIMIVRIAGGRIRRTFVPPAPGGSVYLEMVAVMAGSFLLLQLAGGALASLVVKKGAEPPEWLLPVSLAMQWLLFPVIFWPLLRGVSFAEHRRRMGWTSGKGVFREIGAGLFAYMASLPVLAAVLLLTLGVMAFYQYVTKAVGREPEPIDNEIVKIIAEGNGLVLFMFFLLATIWAPVVEEGVFRGALYRHLRARWVVPGAAVVSAVAFGAMHGYAVFLLLPVITLGTLFALLREWRGSMIAGMTVHAVHNGVLLAMVITLFTLAKPE